MPKIDDYKDRMDSPIGAVLINSKTKKPIKKQVKKPTAKKGKGK